MLVTGLTFPGDAVGLLGERSDFIGVCGFPIKDGSRFDGLPFTGLAMTGNAMGEDNPGTGPGRDRVTGTSAVPTTGVGVRARRLAPRAIAASSTS